MIRTINTEEITAVVKEMCIEANHFLSPDMDAAMKKALENEKSELEALKETDIDSSIILGFNPMNSTVQGKIAMWEDGDDGSYEKGLLEVAEDCGITKFMMDTAVTPLGQGAGIAGSATFAEKSKWGYPVGSGIHNIPSAWDWLRDYKNESGNKTAFTVCDIGANILQVMVGGDFVLFGPIDNATICFPAIAQTDMFIAEAAARTATRITPTTILTIQVATFFRIKRPTTSATRAKA